MAPGEARGARYRRARCGKRAATAGGAKGGDSARLLARRRGPTPRLLQSPIKQLVPARPERQRARRVLRSPQGVPRPSGVRHARQLHRPRLRLQRRLQPVRLRPVRQSARWETPTQIAHGSCLRPTARRAAAGDYGKFEDCAEAPSPWSEAADAAEATVDAAATAARDAAAATSYAASAADASAAAASRAPGRRGARSRTYSCACSRRRSRSSATPSAGCGASTSSSSASTTPSPRRAWRCGRRRRRGSPPPS